jgi:glycosyltransferase involved in cell wall biosynthesis
MVAGIERTGYPGSRIAMIPNAADLDFFQRDADAGRSFRRRLGIEDQKILIAYTGTLGRINDVGYLVRVAAAARNDDRLVFLTVGDGQEKARVEALARESAVLNRSFHMLPSVAKREVAAVLSAADIAVSLVLPIPELEANSANKFFDGLAAGCCMAVNHGGWQAELLEATGSGIRLPYDPEAAALALSSLADDPGRIRNAGQNARRLAEERFSRDALAAQVGAVLADAIDSSTNRVH